VFGKKGGGKDDKVVDFKGKAPKVVGTVMVMLMEGGNVALQVTGGLSQLQALGILAAAQYTVLSNAPKDVKRIIPVAGAADDMLKKGPDGNGKK